MFNDIVHHYDRVTVTVLVHMPRKHQSDKTHKRESRVCFPDRAGKVLHQLDVLDAR